MIYDGIYNLCEREKYIFIIFLEYSIIFLTVYMYIKKNSTGNIFKKKKKKPMNHTNSTNQKKKTVAITLALTVRSFIYSRKKKEKDLW